MARYISKVVFPVHIFYLFSTWDRAWIAFTTAASEATTGLPDGDFSAIMRNTDLVRALQTKGRLTYGSPSRHDGFWGGCSTKQLISQNFPLQASSSLVGHLQDLHTYSYFLIALLLPSSTCEGVVRV